MKRFAIATVCLAVMLAAGCHRRSASDSPSAYDPNLDGPPNPMATGIGKAVLPGMLPAARSSTGATPAEATTSPASKPAATKPAGEPNAAPTEPNSAPAEPNAAPAEPNALPAAPNAPPAEPNAVPAEPNAAPPAPAATAAPAAEDASTAGKTDPNSAPKPGGLLHTIVSPLDREK
jgi:hypothetical protein